MGRKADSKFTSLWEAYDKVRTERLSRESGETLLAAEVWLKDAMTEAGSDTVNAMLDLMKAERKALRRLVRHVRKRQDEDASRAGGASRDPLASKAGASSGTGTPKGTKAAAKPVPAAETKPIAPPAAAKAKAGTAAGGKSAAEGPGEPKPAPRRIARSPRNAAVTRPVRRPRATPTET